jgi:hypothetical protein
MEDSAFASSTCRVARDQAMIRANWTCEHVDHRGRRCTEFLQLDAHHLTYERFGSEDPDDLMILCRRHHIELHGH